MPDGKLGAVEARFADLVWENAPIASRELARLCEKELGWKRTTTYNVPVSYTHLLFWKCAARQGRSESRRRPRGFWTARHAGR